MSAEAAIFRTGVTGRATFDALDAFGAGDAVRAAFGAGDAGRAGFGDAGRAAFGAGDRVRVAFGTETAGRAAFDATTATFAAFGAFAGFADLFDAALERVAEEAGFAGRAAARFGAALVDFFREAFLGTFTTLVSGHAKMP